MTAHRIIRIGTRGSQLALWQAAHVAALLRAVYDDVTVETVVISTRGDETLDRPLAAIGGKGVFTAEIEAALLNGDIDGAVHSLKDLPTGDTPGLTIGAAPERGAAGDVLISRDSETLAALHMGATVGTGSLRRAAQLLHQRPDLTIRDIRGNVPTRIDKLMAADGPYDAIVLAQAGVERLELADRISAYLSPDVMLCAPGQGALGVQCRDDDASRALFARLIHRETWLAVGAERAFLAALDGGCSAPVAAYGVMEGDELVLRGRVNAVDGSQQIDVVRRAHIADLDAAIAVGAALAEDASGRGAEALLGDARS